jgi:hypothetical protein
VFDCNALAAVHKHSAQQLEQTFQRAPATNRDGVKRTKHTPLTTNHQPLTTNHQPLTTNYELFENAPATAAVFDMSGRVVMNASVGMQQEVHDVSNLKPGQYILRFESGEMIRQENFILTR